VSTQGGWSHLSDKTKSLEIHHREWWHTLVIPALGRLRQEELKFEASLGCRMRPYLKTTRKKTPQEMKTTC
jgi:hypothetical protein